MSSGNPDAAADVPPGTPVEEARVSDRAATRIGPTSRWWVLVATALAITALWPAPPARACSCAFPTVAEVVASDPDVGIAVVRRVDEGGAGRGTVVVEERVRGDLPDELDIELDDGGSCAPALVPGQVAVLAFDPAGDGWRAKMCGQLVLGDGLAAAYGGLTVDPAATGPPAVLLAGGLPGAEMATLDDRLRVLATGDHGIEAHRLEPCGEDEVVITGWDADDVRQVALRVAVGDLTILDRATIGGDLSWPTDVACDDAGTASAVVAVEDETTYEVTLVHLADVFDEDAGASEVGAGDHGEVVSGDVVTIEEGRLDGSAETTVRRITPGTGEVVWEVGLDDVIASRLVASPDAGLLAVEGYVDDEVALLLDAATGEVRARVDGRQFFHTPWVGDDRVVTWPVARHHEPYLAAPEPDPEAVRDRDLAPVGGVPATVASVRPGADGLLLTGGGPLTVVGHDGTPHDSSDGRLFGVHDGILLAPVVASASPVEVPDVEVPDVADPDVDTVSAGVAADEVALAGTSGASGTSGWLAVTGAGAALLAVGAAVAVRTRRASRGAGPG